MLQDLFKLKAVAVSLPLEEEQALIARAQQKDGDAVWALLLQYRGLLQKTAYEVRKSARTMTPEQIEDLEADLVLAAVDTIQTFDAVRFVRLSQVLPGRLRDVGREMATTLAVPRGTLALWFKIWREADQDFPAAEVLAPVRGMSANTFRAIAHALAASGSEWVNVPYSADVPTADSETYALAHRALALLTPAEREVIELSYGFRGDPKTDQEVGEIREAGPRTIREQRVRALDKMREGLGAVQD